MTDQSVIIVGAGPSGLLAAHLLSAKGFKVTVLEARGRIGGRIHTVPDALTGMPTEFGAEFIHGDLGITLGLLKEAGIPYHKVKGEFWQVRSSEPQEHGHVVNHWKEFEDELGKLETDQTVDHFLNEKFGAPEYKALRESVENYAAGYDTADPKLASTMALAKEWLDEDNTNPYRLDNGYKQLLNYLRDSCVKHGGEINISSAVSQIRWQPGEVSVSTTDGREFRADKAIITIPATLLRSTPDIKGCITFTPAIPQIAEAAKQIAIGSVIKILFFFNEAFWLTDEVKEHLGKDMNKVAFMFSSETIPTWWTQNPNKIPLLTGWVGGPPAQAMKDKTDAEIKNMALASLSNIFKLPVSKIENLLRTWHVANWTRDPYAMGSYSYTTVGCEPSRHILNTPIDNTLYFAGEALYDGPLMGTVEAAFATSKHVAEKILAPH